MKMSLDLRTSLTQTLTPQQIQYLKLLQLPVVQLEQQVLQEMEQNPMLESSSEAEVLYGDGDSFDDAPSSMDAPEDVRVIDEYSYDGDSDDYAEPPIADQGDPFEFHKLIWQDDSDYYKKGKQSQGDDDDYEPFQYKDVSSFTDNLLEQVRMLELTTEEMILAEQIIGNIDTDGYLRRELSEIVDETNALIAEINYETIMLHETEEKSGINPAKKFMLSYDSTNVLTGIYEHDPELEQRAKNYLRNDLSFLKKKNGYHQLSLISLEIAEKMLKSIQQLDPPGVGSRNVQECLIAQCKAVINPTESQRIALEILSNTYDAFTKKHYHIIIKELGLNEEQIRGALEVIRRLNPKPGGDESVSEHNTVIPDFIIEKDDENGELLITVNDSHIPAIRLNKAYEKLKKEAQFKLSNKETKDWIRNKYEDAKFLIQAIRQRKSTMLKVMTSIAHLQIEFFRYGSNALRPLIYKDVSEDTGLDISTVCRIVNGKFVQTEFGTFELKFFFSESLPNDEGEEVATRVIKQIIKDIIDQESKKKPFSDDKIAKVLKDRGYNVARRTVAKYREQLRIPVARLRKEL